MRTRYWVRAAANPWRAAVPAHYTEVPPETPLGPPNNVGHLYLRMAKAIRDGTPVEPDFDVA